jgi:hypothetical protein
MHQGRIDFHSRQKDQVWDSNRGNPTVFFQQRMAHAIHLCLYACHTVLQPTFDQRHSNHRRILTTTEEGMQKWVQRNFPWLSDVNMEK